MTQAAVQAADVPSPVVGDLHAAPHEKIGIPLSANPLRVPRTLKNPRLRMLQRVYGLPTVILPHLAVAYGIWQLAVGRAGKTELLVLVAMYVPTMFGITVGWHRYLSHGSFKTYAPIRAVLAVLGSMTAQGPVVNWVANHRRHHKSSDVPGDPHSPYMKTDGTPIGIVTGFWHAHVAWLFDGELTNSLFYTKDLLRDPVLHFINHTYLVWIALGIALPAGACWLLFGTPEAAFQGMLWGGLIRIALVQNATWAIGSLSHIIGHKDFVTGDESRNNMLLAIPILGDGWHNNHHAFPGAAVVQFKWYQADPSGWVIRALRVLRLAWDVRDVPPQARLDARRVRSAGTAAP